MSKDNITIANEILEKHRETFLKLRISELEENNSLLNKKNEKLRDQLAKARAALEGVVRTLENKSDMHHLTAYYLAKDGLAELERGE